MEGDGQGLLIRFLGGGEGELVAGDVVLGSFLFVGETLDRDGFGFSNLKLFDAKITEKL